ncbi:hypothetical protein GTID1_00665 [Geobacillus thermodenitrificans]|nr:hypothetical protein GTID1_00665 [Geobacillus thermodenitrificans]
MPASSFRVVSGIESFIFATQFGHRPLLESLMVVNQAGLHELLNVKLFLPLYGASHPFSHLIPSVFFTFTISSPSSVYSECVKLIYKKFKKYVNFIYKR